MLHISCWGNACDNIKGFYCVDNSNTSCFIYVEEYSFIDKIKDAYNDTYIDDMICSNLFEFLLDDYNYTSNGNHITYEDSMVIHVWNSSNTQTNINCGDFQECQASSSLMNVNKSVCCTSDQACSYAAGSISASDGTIENRFLLVCM